MKTLLRLLPLFYLPSAPLARAQDPGTAKPAPLEAAPYFFYSYNADTIVDFAQSLPAEGTKEYQEAILDASVKKEAGFAFYPARVLAPEHKIALAKLFGPTYLAVWSGPKAGKTFRPEYAFKWGGGKYLKEIWIGLDCPEILLRSDGRELRYDLNEAGRAEVPKLMAATVAAMQKQIAQSKAADPLTSEHLRSYLRKPEVAITVYEGLPAPGTANFEAESKRTDIIKLGDHAFYIKGHDASAMRELLRARQIVEKWTGAKECGGFHPDYAVHWKNQNGTKDVYMLVCFTCGEVIYLSGAQKYQYDLGPTKRDELIKTLKAFPKQAPAAP